jgi:hypothetical protein
MLEEKNQLEDVNSFINLPSFIQDTIKKYEPTISNDKINLIIKKFKNQYPEIDNKSYDLLNLEYKQLEKQFY